MNFPSRSSRKWLSRHCGVGYEGYSAAGGSWLLNGFVDGAGARRFVGCDVLGRAYRTSQGRSTCAATRAETALAACQMRFEKIGSFGLTEPWLAPPHPAEC